MPDLFRHHDSLRLFVEIARQNSFSDAATVLNMTKGAISYQIKTLEGDLGLALFRRSSRGVRLTRHGRDLLAACQTRYREIEADIQTLKGGSSESLTVGISSYFAARWLSPRLMSFMQDHPEIQLRLQPMIRLFDLEEQGVDIAVRWGDGNWYDAEITPFLPMPAFPVGNAEVFRAVQRDGIEQVFPVLTLLRDHDDSDAWTDWMTVAQLPHEARRDTLIVPDPNVRVQAVIDGQGIALMDDLIRDELRDKKLFRLSDIALSDYGYFLARPHRGAPSATLEAFAGWLQGQ